MTHQLLDRIELVLSVLVYLVLQGPTTETWSCWYIKFQYLRLYVLRWSCIFHFQWKWMDILHSWTFGHFLFGMMILRNMVFGFAGTHRLESWNFEHYWNHLELHYVEEHTLFEEADIRSYVSENHLVYLCFSNQRSCLGLQDMYLLFQSLSVLWA